MTWTLVSFSRGLGRGARVTQFLPFEGQFLHLDALKALRQQLVPVQSSRRSDVVLLALFLHGH
jgi:hypothetical protein